MELIVPDIVADVRKLSAILSVMGLAIGVVLWLAGWWSHRFWFVLGFTVLGGIWGLQNAVALKSQPLVAAVGVGLAAGILALTLVRLGAFAAGGYASLLLTHAALPTWDQPLISFLVGGLIAFFMFRYWTMALTSLAGVVLIGHSSLALADKLGKFDAVVWSETNANMLSTACGAAAFGGFVVQLLVDKLRRPSDGAPKADKKDVKKPKSEGGVLATLASFRRAG